MVRFDLTNRFSTRLVKSDAYEVWLISWDLGQDTLLHDHGDSNGAFTVTSGELTEDFGAIGGSALQTRTHVVGAAAGFGRGYAHNLVNVGPEPAVTIHAYSPPLTAMNFYCWLPTGIHFLRRLPVLDGDPIESTPHTIHDVSRLER